MKIYIATYDEHAEYKECLIKAESLEIAYEKALWGFGRKLVDVREATAEELLQEHRRRMRYLTTFEGQLKSIGFSDAEVANIKEKERQERKQQRNNGVLWRQRLLSSKGRCVA
jgi:hypothetical protein